jgi:Flp pilus assembly protein CpaB
MLTVAAFGIIAVLAVGFLFKKLMATPVVEVKPPEAKILPMAITEIESGTVITRAHVGNGRAELGVKLPEDTFLSLDGVIGRIAREKITAATPLQGSMFYAPGDFPDLKVSPGKQAVVVKVSQTTAVLSQKMKPLMKLLRENSCFPTMPLPEVNIPLYVSTCVNMLGTYA